MRTYTRPYRKTGNVLIDALMNAAHLWGCSDIHYSEGVITFTHAGKSHELLFSPRLSRCTDVWKLISSPPQQPGECKSDPAVWAAQAA